jgi:hypothetical protein
MKPSRNCCKLRRVRFCETLRLFAVVQVLLTPLYSVTAAQAKLAGKQAKTDTAPAAVEAASVLVEIPRSEFKMPAAPGEGKDPFYPNSIRVYGTPPSLAPDVTTNRPPPVMDLLLSGVSGTAEKPFAIINNQTFAIGEERQMTLSGQSVRVVCLEINPQAQTAVVQANGVRRELRLKQDQ